MCSRCRKSIKSTSSMTSHVITCIIPISLLNAKLLNQDPVLNYNITNIFNLPSDIKKEGITPEVSNYGDPKVTRPADIGNEKKNIRPVYMDK